MNREKAKARQRRRRQLRVRRRTVGTPDRPRLAVFRSLKHIYAQVIDDTAGRTLVAASSFDVRAEVARGGDRQAAAAVGRTLAERASQVGVKKVCFDRRSYKFHGRIKELADAARAGGLEF